MVCKVDLQYRPQFAVAEYEGMNKALLAKWYQESMYNDLVVGSVEIEVEIMSPWRVIQMDKLCAPVPLKPDAPLLTTHRHAPNLVSIIIGDVVSAYKWFTWLCGTEIKCALKMFWVLFQPVLIYIINISSLSAWWSHC